MKYSIKFFLEKRKGITKNVPINLNVTFSGKRMDYYTGKRCDVDQWNGEKVVLTKVNPQLANGQSAREFNTDLNRLSLTIDDIFKAFEVKKINPSVLQLRNELKIKLGKITKLPDSESFYERFNQFVDEKNYQSEGSVICTKAIIKSLKKFKPGLSYGTFDIQCITDYRNHLIDAKNFSKNTVNLYLTKINTFIKYSINHGWAEKNPFNNYKIEPQVYGNPVYLTIEERDVLFNAKIENKELELTRDIFLLQCLVGCRFGDLMKLTKSNIIKGNIEYIASKTKDHGVRVAVIPLTKKALSIIQKYDLPGGKLVPYMLIRKMEENLKALFAKIEINRIVTIPDKKTRISKQVPICEIATTHMARRVFIGGLYKKGVKDAIIASMSGHVVNSRAFSRYYNIDIEDQKAAISLIE